MVKILDIKVKLCGCYEVKGSRVNVSMVPFEGTVSGDFFTGRVLPGAVDTQKTAGDVTMLSARYMLEGTDMNGRKCRVFIENSSDEKGVLHPVIVTDSKVLSHWETARLTSKIEPVPDGVNVTIYME